MRCEHWITAPLRAMVAVVLLAAALVPSARAHKASDAYLHPKALQGQAHR